MPYRFKNLYKVHRSQRKMPIGQLMKRRARRKQRHFLRAHVGRNRRTGGFNGLEWKFLDTAWNGVIINSSTTGAGIELQPSTPASILCLSAPAQGDGESNRDGRKFTLRSAFFSGLVNFTPLANQTDSLDYSPIYFALVLDTQCNAATVVSEDVFDNPSSTALAMMPQPLRNLQNSKRFKILDSTTIWPAGAYSMTDGTNTGSHNVMVQPTVKLSWKGAISVTASGTTAVVGSITDNALHIIACAGATNGTPSFEGKCRVRFTG